ncbi:MAG: MBG domain-containing protein, partial [Clostridiales bacterium]|nr:MBG domain-containing protein [Clostridiales bacterium]
LPAMQGWTEGETPNAPRGEAAEGTVSFTYRTADGDLLGATAPTAAGDYFLIAYVGAIGEYNELSAEVGFTVFPKVLRVNGWTVAPNIQGWTEGDTPYTPVGEALVGEVIFSYQREDGTPLSDAPTDAGSYILVATVLAEDYEGMTAEIAFTIAARPLKTNSWTVVPNIQGWTEGAEANEPVGEAKVGEVQFIYRTKGGEALADKPTAAGSYVLVATVIAEDYETLTAEIEFTVATANSGDALENPEETDHSAATLAFMIVFLVLFAGTAAAGLWYFLRTRKSVGKAKDAKKGVRESADDEKNGEDAIRDTEKEN